MLLFWLASFGSATLALRYEAPRYVWLSAALLLASYTKDGSLGVYGLRALVACIGLYLFGVYAYTHVPRRRAPTSSIKSGDCFVLDRPIQNGEGAITLREMLWCVHGPDLPAGTWVRVVSLEDQKITVEPYIP